MKNATIRIGTEYHTVPAEDRQLPWQKQGLTYTASGYGNRIPTAHVVKYKGRWRRVYCCIHSNIGTCYIGKLADGIIVQSVG